MTLLVAVRHAFSDFALDATFTAPTPGVVALFGPSGAGKSSVLAAVAGLLRADAARVVVDGAVLEDSAARVRLKPERRGVGLVFQDSRLFPHMTVAGNLRYGARRAAGRGILFDDVVGLLGLGGLLGRRPGGLSGGEKQRVAIGRALLSQPRLLLLDEPLASLDAARRLEILPYLARLKQSLRLPMLLVTHALDEVLRLADTLVLLEGGRVRASGPLESLLARVDLPLAARDDAAALLTAVVHGHDVARRLTVLELAGERLFVPLCDRPVGEAVRLRVPAREVILAKAVPGEISVHNVLSGVVGAVVEDGALALVAVRCEFATLLSRVTPDAVQRLGLVEGSRVFALIKSVSVELF